MSQRPVVLVVDDDPDILDLVSFRLDRWGIDTILASDGEEALALAAEHRPLLAIVDVMMPKLDGFDLTRALRSRKETRAMPILLLTARSRDSDVTEGFAAGADDYVRKPFSPRELRTRVEAILARTARADAERALPTRS